MPYFSQASQYILQNNLENLKLIYLDQELHQTSNGKSLLSLACEGRVEIVEYLLSLDGIDPSLGNPSPLFVACSKGHAKIVNLLLKKDKSLSTRCCVGINSKFLIICSCL